MSHTPGPWTIREGNMTTIQGTDGQAVASPCWNIDWREPADRAKFTGNAHLIAAAPDLLAALEHLVRLLEPQELDGVLNVPGLATLNGARAAIRKARGES